jgi:hypothetical protein
VSQEREWWLRVPAVLVDPKPVFAALRNDDRDDLDARQEPLLALVWLAGIAWVLADPVAGRIFDDPDYDWLVAPIWAFVTGGIVGVGAYWVLGGALALGLRSLGSTGTYRRARHILGFAAVPFVFSIPVFLVRVAIFGGDALRSGGADSGAGGTVLRVIQLSFAAWTLVLLVLGVRTVESWSWWRSLGSLVLLALFLAAFVVLVGGVL